jgi:hypothetical protein
VTPKVKNLRKIRNQLVIDVIAPCRANKYFCDQQIAKISESLMAQHGIFYMENAGGYKPAHPETAPSTAVDERQPSCFALEEEKGEHWHGSGAMARVINEARTSL